MPRTPPSDTPLLWIVDIYGPAGDGFTSALQATATTAAFVTLGAALLAAALLRQVRAATA